MFSLSIWNKKKKKKRSHMNIIESMWKYIEDRFRGHPQTIWPIQFVRNDQILNAMFKRLIEWIFLSFSSFYRSFLFLFCLAFVLFLCWFVQPSTYSIKSFYIKWDSVICFSFFLFLSHSIEADRSVVYCVLYASINWME